MASIPKDLGRRGTVRLAAGSLVAEIVPSLGRNLGACRGAAVCNATTTVPLIALAVELKRRGHVPVMALPAVYAPKIQPLGIEFHPVRPDIDPKNTILVEMIYDVKKGTERGLREFLFPVLHQTYDDLLIAATQPQRAVAAARRSACSGAR